MKVVDVHELDRSDDVVKSNLDESDAIKEEVFAQVKKLFSITSNEKEIWARMVKKLKKLKAKSSYVGKTKDKFLSIQSKLKLDISNLDEKLKNSIILLKKSLRGEE